MRVANCTSAAYFHLLRRQAALLLVDPAVVILTPRASRHPMVASAPRELAEGRFRMVIQDHEAESRAGDIRRVIMCSGKVYVDLMAAEQRADRPDIAICRMEQLYPVPMRDLRAAIEAFPEAGEVVWVQEEPENMGAWSCVPPPGCRADERFAVARAYASQPKGPPRATHQQQMSLPRPLWKACHATALEDDVPFAARLFLET
jgi:2-oxoglutarate dehydrogenase E1 component